MSVSLALSHRAIRQGEEQFIYLMVRLRQPEVKAEQERLPLNLSFVLDRSGSMTGEKLEYTKAAVQFALEHLGKYDTVSAVAFDDTVRVLFPPGSAAQKDQMSAAVREVYPGGITNLSGGLLKGVGLVRQNVRAGQVNRVILLTDGLANAGVTDPARLAAKAAEVNAAGVSLSTLGVGEDFQEDLLIEIAERGQGNFHFIASPDKIPDIFRQELQGLLTIAAQNVDLSVRPLGGARVTAILGYEPVWGPEVGIALPDMYGGDVKTVLVELAVCPQGPGRADLAQVRLRYDAVQDGLAAVEYTAALSAEVTNIRGECEAGIDLQVLKEVEIFRAAQAREEAVREADSFRFSAAHAILTRQKERMEEFYAQSQNTEVLEEIGRIESNLKMMEDGEYSPMQRKMMKNESYRARRKR